MSGKELPDGWAETQCSEFCTGRNKTFNPKTAVKEKYVLYSVPSHATGKPEVVTPNEIGSSKQHVNPNDTLISKINPRLNRTWVVGEHPDQTVIASTEWIVFAASDAYISAYLAMFLQQASVCDFLSHNASGVGGSLTRIKPAIFDQVLFPLPPLPEQKRIVARIEELFSELDAGEASLRRARQQLGVYRQSLLKQAFEGKLTAPWRTQNPDLLESPDQLLARIQEERQSCYEEQLNEWRACARDWEKNGKEGKRPKKPREPLLQDRNAAATGSEVVTPHSWAVELVGNCPIDSLIGLVRAAAEQHAGPSGFSYIKMDRLDMLGSVDLSPAVFVETTEEEAQRFALHAGDILFNTRNSVELVGKTAIVRREPGSLTVYNNNLMRIRLPECLDPVFVGLQLCSQPFRQYMEKVKKATTSVAAIYAKDFWPLPLVVCSLPEQQEIVRLLDEQFEVIEQNEREIDAALKRSEALRQSILKRAFTGQLVPQDPTDEPASELLKRIRAEREAAAAAKPKKKAAKKKATRKKTATAPALKRPATESPRTPDESAPTEQTLLDL